MSEGRAALATALNRVGAPTRVRICPARGARHSRHSPCSVGAPARLDSCLVESRK